MAVEIFLGSGSAPLRSDPRAQGVTYMQSIPATVADFLAGKRIVVAGVSRTGRAPANAIFRRLQQCGYEAIPVNPNATELEGARSYPDLSSVPGAVHGLVVAT